MKRKRDAIQEKPEDPLIEMGKFYFINRKYTQAINEFKKAAKLNTGNPEICYNLGLVYESKNELDLAKNMYEKALAIKPDYVIAKEHLDKLIGV